MAAFGTLRVSLNDRHGRINDGQKMAVMRASALERDHAKLAALFQPTTFRIAWTSFYQEVNGGRLRTVKFGRSTRISREDAEARLLIFVPSPLAWGPALADCRAHMPHLVVGHPCASQALSADAAAFSVISNPSTLPHVGE